MLYKRIIAGLEMQIMARKTDLYLEKDENLKKRIKADIDELKDAHFKLTGDRKQEFEIFLELKIS